jgi:PEP-CTERM motif
MKTIHSLAAIAAALTFGAPAWAADVCQAGNNLIANCGFESGTFDGWTVSGTDVPRAENLFYGVETADPFPSATGGTTPSSGDFQAFFLDQAAHPITLSQTFGTKVGTTYTVSFALAQYDVNDPFDTSFINSLVASFGGSTLLSLTNSADLDYATYTYDVLATSSTSTFEIVTSDTTGEFLLDSVSVAAPVPEPAAPLMVVAGLGLLASIARRRRRG